MAGLKLPVRFRSDECLWEKVKVVHCKFFLFLATEVVVELLLEHRAAVEEGKGSPAEEVEDDW